jgi:DNA repair photolyase
VNPYGGCEHGCLYCYAQELTHTPWEEWRIVKVKTNILGRLEKELPNTDGVICIGTVTDPYQKAEARFELTRQCVTAISAKRRKIHIDTKSDLILRDIDILKDAVGDFSLTLTTLDDRISKMTEPGAPLPEKRLDAMREMVSEGLRTYALVGPVTSALNGKEKELAEAIASTGVRRIYLDRLRERPLLKKRMSRIGIGASTDAVERML